MELEKMSNAELISLVRRQEQELAGARADMVAVPLVSIEGLGSIDAAWEDAFKFGTGVYQLKHVPYEDMLVPTEQQGGGELLQDDLVAFEATFSNLSHRKQVDEDGDESYCDDLTQGAFIGFAEGRRLAKLQLVNAFDSGAAWVRANWPENNSAALAQRAAPVAELPQDERAAFEAYFGNTLSCDGRESEQQIEDCRVAAYDAWREATRRALAQRAASVPAQAGQQPVAEVLPCPFCGSAAHVDYDRMGLATNGRVHCVAMDCRADVYSQDGKDAAISMWNRRAAPVPAASVQCAPSGIVPAQEGQSCADWQHRVMSEVFHYTAKCLDKDDAEAYAAQQEIRRLIASPVLSANVQPDIGRDAALVAAATALAWKWHRDAVKDGFACSEPAQELFEVLGWPADVAAQAAPEVASVPTTCDCDDGMVWTEGCTSPCLKCQDVTDDSASVPDEPFMYAIMDPDGAAYYEEHCVGPTPDALYSAVNALNDSPDTGYQVVPLYTRPQPAPAVLTDEQIDNACGNVWNCDYQGDGKGYDRAIARAVLAAAIPAVPTHQEK